MFWSNELNEWHIIRKKVDMKQIIGTFVMSESSTETVTQRKIVRN